MVVYNTKIIIQWNNKNHDRIERRFDWPEQENLQLCYFDCAKKMDR